MSVDMQEACWRPQGPSQSAGAARCFDLAHRLFPLQGANDRGGMMYVAHGVLYASQILSCVVNKSWKKYL